MFKSSREHFYEILLFARSIIGVIDIPISVSHYFGVSNGARHRAAGDAIATAHVLTRLLRVAEDRGIETWESLSALLAPSTVRRKRRKRSAWPRSVDVDPTV